MPVNWYAALVVIVLIGLVSVAVAKYHYNQNPPVVEPTTNTTWHAALAFDICGTTQPALAASPSTATTGLTTTGDGVLLIHPKNASEAGNNATLGKFADGYTGLTLTNTTLKYPSSSVPLYKNGQKCGKGTPDAGKVGEVEARWWVDHDEDGEQPGGTDGRPHHGQAGRPQVREPPAHHGGLRARQRGAAQADRGHQAPAAGPRRQPAGGDHDHHRAHGGDHDAGVDHADHRGVDHDHEAADDHDDEVMKAVVLVGGEGTRLRPLTLSAPKQMLPIVGVPMIERVLEHLASHGVDEAVLSLGYLPDAFMKAYPDGHAAGVRLTYAVEPEPLDTAGAVRFAATFAGVDETFVVVNGDVLTDMDLTALVDFHRDRGAEGTIALHPVADPSAFGVVPTDRDGRVTAFVEKPPRDEAPTNEINAGTYVLEASVLRRIPEAGRVSIERETFPAMVRDGGLFALSDGAYWLDTGTPSAYLEANFDYVNGRRGPEVAPGLTRRDGQVLTEGESDLDGQVVGPSVVFAGCRVEPGAQVARSILGPGAVITSGAVVTDSVLMEGCHVAANAKVAGSVMGPRSVVGQRADIRPVSVLGADAVVSSGTVVDGERVSG